MCWQTSLSSHATSYEDWGVSEQGEFLGSAMTTPNAVACRPHSTDWEPVNTTQLQGARLWKHLGHSQGIPPPAPAQPHTAGGGIREQLPNFAGENSDRELSGRWILWHRHRGTSRMQEQPANSAGKHAFQSLVVQKLFLQNTNYICILCSLIIQHQTYFSGTNVELKMCYIRLVRSAF